MRLSSPSMARAVIDGAADAGADVRDLAMVGTEMVYFAVGELGLDGGIAVTASHNPKEYTGMKIVRRGALPVGGDSGFLDVRDRAMSEIDMSGGQAPGHVSNKQVLSEIDMSGGQAPGHVSNEQVQAYDIWPAYVDRVMSFVDVSAIR